MDARLVGLTTLVLTLTSSAPLIAQTDTSATQPAPGARRHAVCWIPAPGSLCRSYLVTEVNFEKPFRSPDGDLVGRYGWTLGPMINVGQRDAVGVLASWMSGGRRSGPYRADGRYRRWLTGSTGIDLALGYAQHGVAPVDEPDVWLRGVTAAAAIEHKMFGIESRVDRVRGSGREETSATVSVRAGGPAAPLTALAAYVVLLAVFMIDNDG